MCLKVLFAVTPKYWNLVNSLGMQAEVRYLIADDKTFIVCNLCIDVFPNS